MDKHDLAIAELERVEAELAKMAALQKRRDHLRQYIDLGRILFDQQASIDAPQKTMTPSPAWSVAPPASSPTEVPGPIYAVTGRKREFTKDRIVSGATSLITNNGPMQTAELVKMLEQDGVIIGGADKVLTVSSILSRTKDQFKSDRAAGGWTLVKAHKEEPPQGAPTPAGA